MLNISRLFLAGLTLAVILALSWPAEAQDKVKLGNVTVSLKAPAGLVRVDGLMPQADAYIKTLEPKFKLQILAFYADKNDWKKFVENVAAGKPASIPRLAMICVPRKMAKKKYDTKDLRKEFKSYSNWFSVGANNRPTAALLTRQANSKLKEIMGLDLDFKYQIGSHTRKISETGNSLSLAVLSSFKVNGKTTGGLLCATALGVGDKIIYSGYFEEGGSSAKLDEIIAKAVQWRSALNSAQ